VTCSRGAAHAPRRTPRALFLFFVILLVLVPAPHSSAPHFLRLLIRLHHPALLILISLVLRRSDLSSARDY
jgi:hypothetical protein